MGGKPFRASTSIFPGVTEDGDKYLLQGFLYGYKIVSVCYCIFVNRFGLNIGISTIT